MGDDDEAVVAKRQKLREQIKANLVAAAAAGIELEGKDIFSRLFSWRRLSQLLLCYGSNYRFSFIEAPLTIAMLCPNLYIQPYKGFLEYQYVVTQDFIFALTETGSEDDGATEMSEDDFFLAGSEDNADADDEWTDKTSRHVFI